MTRVSLEYGFSLLEMLITVVVVSIGLLGLAGLQFQGLRAANSAQTHTLATLLTQDISDRLHANRSVVTSYDGITLDSTTGVSLIKDCAVLSNDCSPSELRDFDLYQWYQLIVPTAGSPLLPNLSISISLTGINGFAVGSFRSILQWGDPSGPQSLTTDFSVCTNTDPTIIPAKCIDP